MNAPQVTTGQQGTYSGGKDLVSIMPPMAPRRPRRRKRSTSGDAAAAASLRKQLKVQGK